MTLVTNNLLKTLKRNLKKSGTVVWYDPEQAYTRLAAELTSDKLDEATVLRYRVDRGFIWLRHELETYWQTDHSPRILVYVPLAQANTAHALIEFEMAGAVLRPGMQPPEQNTALAVIARQALEQVFPPAAVAEIVSQVEAGQLTLEELDKQSEKGLEGQAGVVNAIFNTGNANEVALRFLSDTSLDNLIESRHAVGGIASLMTDALGVPFQANGDAAALRAQLARHILLTDLLLALAPDTPPALQTITLAERAVAQEAAVGIAARWRNQLDLQSSYVQWADRIQGEIGLTSMNISWPALARTITFAAAELQLQIAVEQALQHSTTNNLVTLAEKRMTDFWARQQPAIKIRWEVIWDAGRVLSESARIELALKGKKWTAESLLARYAYGEEQSQPWCLLDTAQRHLERDFHRFDLNHQQHQPLIALVAMARQRYAAAASHLAELFTRTYEQQQFHLPQVLLQADLFHELVTPAMSEGKVAYLLVDALRFEMAHELKGVIMNEWSTQLGLALATPPTITDIGMAALLPGAEKGVSFTEANGKLIPVINNQPLRNRSERVQAFRQALSKKEVAETKLDQLAPLSSKNLAKQIKQADIILATATDEIDGLCENNPTLARRMLDDVFNQLRRGIRTLLDQGVNTIIITADHGYLFGEEITPGDSISPPGGQKTVLKRRVWLGKGGAHIAGTLRQSLSAFGINSDLELVTPYNLACFKVPGGSLSYFHGGLSLPELVVPVLTIRAAGLITAKPGGSIVWALTLGSKAITTRFITVTVAGQTSELLPLKPPVVRLEIRAGNQPVSVPVGATYGFKETTKDVHLQTHPDDIRSLSPNTITLQITEDIAVDSVTIHLLDSTTGLSLSRLDNVPVNIAL